VLHALWDVFLMATEGVPNDLPTDDPIPDATLGERALIDIAVDMRHVSAALLTMAGIAKGEIAGDGTLIIRPLTAEEQAASGQAPMRFVPGTTSTHGGGVAWVMSPPAPHNDVVFVCVPDADFPAGMRCYVEQKLPGGERAKWNVELTAK
jgi:hypothetical protein